MKEHQPCCADCGGIMTGDCRDSNCPCHQEAQPESWEVEFQKLDNNELLTAFCERHLPGGMGEIHDDNLQTLIAQIVVHHKQELREKIEGMKVYCDPKSCNRIGNDECDICVKNETIDEILKLLE